MPEASNEKKNQIYLKMKKKLFSYNLFKCYFNKYYDLNYAYYDQCNFHPTLLPRRGWLSWRGAVGGAVGEGRPGRS